jgi:GDPmannose 4,6-dehydratase
MSTPRALITGISGQDGSYLAELLLSKGYEVFGVVRGSPTARYENLAAIADDVTLLQGDLLDQMTLLDAINSAQPDELYNLAATSFVPASWRQPVMTAQFTAVGVTAMLEAIRITNPEIRVYQASSSEIFSATSESPQNERTPFRPHTPYGVAKLYGHLMVSSYRDQYGMHLSSGIAFNHESPRRPPEFVTRKVTRGAAAIKLGLQRALHLGDLTATRDWGFAGDFAEAMWLMLQRPSGDDFVLATGVSRTVGELAATAFTHVGLDAGDYIVVDPELVRPRDPVRLVGDPRKAREELGWEPRTTFAEMIGAMVDADLAQLQAVQRV